MKFNEVKDGLEWFYKKYWKKRPSGVRSLPLLKTPSGSYITQQMGDVVSTYHKIDTIIESTLNPREAFIIQNEFFQDETQEQLAYRFQLSSDRMVRKVRDRALKKLEGEFRTANLLSKQRVEEPVYAHG